MRVLRAIVLGVGFALGAPAQEAAPKPFDGVWDTTYGALTLTQTGDTVEGSYGSRGSLRGTVAGGRLSYRYRDPESRGVGWFELESGGGVLRGKWRPDGQEHWREWAGTRVALEAPSPLAGVYQTHFGRLRLIVTGDRVRGRYAQDGALGTLEGTLAGDALTFRWTEAGSSGDGEFSFAADRSGFTGRYRVGEDGAWKPWNGTRVGARQGVVWLTVLEAAWERRLDEPEYSWGAMLRAYLKRHPHVKVRHRRVYDRADLERALFEVALLPERTMVLVACHGEGGTLWAGSDRVPAKDVASALSDAPNAFLLHFSSCEVLVDGVAKQLREAAGRPLSVSGYAVAVDWAGSAVLEFLYLDLVLGRGMTPQRAARVVRKELRCAGDEPADGSPLGALKFRVAPE